MKKQISVIALLSVLAFGGIALAQKSANSAPQMKENMRPKQALRMELYVYETRLSGAVSYTHLTLPTICSV